MAFVRQSEKVWRWLTMKRWRPTSKMTGVFLAGFIYAFGVTVVYQVYKVSLHPVDVAWNMLWFVFLAGYGATENRPSPTLRELFEWSKEE